MRRIIYWLGIPIVIVILALATLELRQKLGNREVQREIAEAKVDMLQDIGSTGTLRILPLIDFHSADPELLTEVGVSYLVETDDQTILFDVAQNAGDETPSPLQQNMVKLGVDLASIDTVFISHNHFDHVGGSKWQAKNTFSLGSEQHPFPNPRTQAIVPAQMTYPGLEPVFAGHPMQLGNGLGTTGLATTGVLPRQLVIGWIEEHALVVNVRNLGGVLIVGCGHQTIAELIRRYDAAFNIPLYGIVGGLHFPVPAGRINIGPINAQQRFASGDSLLRPLTMDDVEDSIDLLKSRKLGVIGVGGHDSSDEVIELIREEFGAAHRYVRVGEEIVISGAQQQIASGVPTRKHQAH